MSTNPLIAALDAPDEATVLGWADQLAGEVGHLKVGLEATTALGPKVVRQVSERAAVFWDLKLHDIPNTVAGAATAAQDLRVAMLTVHASGGPAMVAAAAKAAPEVAVLAVTVLTSLGTDELAAVGQDPVERQVPRLARLAVDAGAAGIVCSPQEVAAVRAAVGAGPLVVVPGVRPLGVASHDQARVATPAQAMAAGASHLVVGRPITRAADPAEAARAILAAL